MTKRISAIMIASLLLAIIAGCGDNTTGANDNDHNNTNQPVCGNGQQEGTEECDGANLNGQTCLSQGLPGGTLSCYGNCTFDTSQCDGNDCAGLQCGLGPLGTDCGACPGATEWCNPSGQCVDDCAGLQCGLGPQGLDCGTCPGATDWCYPSGQCEDDCLGRVCGPSPNAGLDCGTCPGATEWCDAQGQCVVDPAGLTWALIPGGNFSMGKAGTEQFDEQPVHTVTVPAFNMTATEVTVQQYGTCVTAGYCTAPDTGNQCNWNDPGYEDHPVNCVYWQQAVDFCVWANGRLPSEAEWEYAARSGGQAITYPWGNDATSCTYAVMDDGGYGCGTGRTMAACSKVAGNTIHGVCDMTGNVWEWVQDWYHSDYTGAPTDGSAWESPTGLFRVFRGGSFVDATDLRATYRGQTAPTVEQLSIGFRCAR